MALFATVGLLSACSYVPDAANPVEWYKGVAGWFEDDEDAGAEPEIVNVGPEQPAAEAQSFPSLSEVPEKAVPITTVEERRRLMKGLSADREHARYVEQGEAAEPQRKAPSTKTAGTEAAKKVTAAVKPTPLPSASAGKPAPAPAPVPAPPPSAAAKPAPAPSAPQVAAAAPAPGKKSYLSPLDKVAPPPPARKAAPTPPAPKPAPRAPVEKAPVGGAEATLSPAPGARAVGDVYSRKLRESAGTVTTTPVGPMAAKAPQLTSPTATSPAPTKTEQEILSPRSLGEFDTTRSGLSVQVGTVLFSHGSTKLTPAGRKVLREIVKQYKASGGTIRVIGHASSRTRDMSPLRHQLANFTVSMRRADVVARELMRLGVKADKIFVGAKSDTEPIYYESMPTGEAGNRRAEIFIDY